MVALAAFGPVRLPWADRLRSTSVGSELRRLLRFAVSRTDSWGLGDSCPRFPVGVMELGRPGGFLGRPGPTARCDLFSFTVSLA